MNLKLSCALAGVGYCITQLGFSINTKYEILLLSPFYRWRDRKCEVKLFTGESHTQVAWRDQASNSGSLASNPKFITTILHSSPLPPPSYVKGFYWNQFSSWKVALKMATNIFKKFTLIPSFLNMFVSPEVVY